MPTPERAQDPGGHGDDASEQDEAVPDLEPEHPLEDPDVDSHQDDDGDDSARDRD